MLGGSTCHILIVEDDNTITNALRRTLEKRDHQMAAVTDFSRVLEQSEQTASDLVPFDISLPFSDGYYQCGQTHRLDQVPIVFILSASDDMSLVVAVNLGMNDFLAKPFKLEVVLAKIQALLRRTYTSNEQETVLRAGVAIPNIGDGPLASGSGKLNLTKNESRIMRCLMEQKGRVVFRDSIIRYLWESEHFIDGNTLIVNMTCLRKKLESIGLEGLIETKKGLGYFLSEAGICNETAMGQEEARSWSPSFFRIVKNAHPFVFQ